MRDIKFRGKRVDNGEWVYGYYVKTETKAWILFENYGEHMNRMEEVIPETVGQYTGLHDKNGKKIYEGDIIDTTNDYEPDYEKNKIAKIDYNIKSAMYRIVIDEISREINIHNCLRIEIIGNIYDNKYLLED